MAVRGPDGRFIPGSGGSGGGGSSGGGGGGGAGPSASGASAMGGAFSKALGAANKLGGGIKALRGGIKSLAKGDLPSAGSAMSSLGNMAGGLATDGAEKLSDALSKLGPAGEAAGAAIQAAAAVFSATIGILADLAGMAIEVTQKMDLMRDQFAGLAGSAKAGKQVQDALGKISAALPANIAARVNDWGKSLLAAGLSGKGLEEAVKGIAAAQALMGDQGAAAAEKMLKQLAEGGEAASKMIKSLQAGGPKAAKMLADMGLRTADLASALGVSEAEFAKMHLSAEQLNGAISKALQKKGKGPLEDMALTLPNILAKVRGGFYSLFTGLGGPVKAFMTAVKELFANFNKGGAIAKGLKPVMTAVLTTVFKYATMAVKAVHNLIGGFMGSKKATGPFAMIGAALRTVWNAIVKVGKALFKAFGGGKETSMQMGGALVALAVTADTVAGAFEFIADVVTEVISMFQTASGIFDEAIGWLTNLADSALDAGGDFINGIINGITSGAGAVIDAVKGLASSALGAFKSALGIASPSKVMMRMGGHVAAGASEGIDRGAGQVQDSAAALGAGVKGGAAKGMAGAGGKGKGGGITINGGVHIEVPHGTPSAWAEEAFAAFMERLAASQGA